jgi:hypothetical protein
MKRERKRGKEEQKCRINYIECPLIPMSKGRRIYDASHWVAHEGPLNDTRTQCNFMRQYGC